jgi:hypothetical protein
LLVTRILNVIKMYGITTTKIYSEDFRVLISTEINNDFIGILPTRNRGLPCNTIRTIYYTKNQISNFVLEASCPSIFF